METINKTVTEYRNITKAEELFSIFEAEHRYEYNIEIDEGGELNIHEPAYINIAFNKKPVSVRENETTYTIDAGAFVITLWKDIKNMHITVI